MIAKLEKTVFRRATYAAAGMTQRDYTFGSKVTTSNCEPKIAGPIMDLCKKAMINLPQSSLLLNLDLTHCTISIYTKGQYVPTHTDKEKIHRHFIILSVSFGSTATMILNGKPLRLQHGSALLFNGTFPHSTLPLEDGLRVNFTFRSWK